MDDLTYVNMLLNLVEFECSGDKRHALREAGFNTPFEHVVGWYAEAMELLSQHARAELRLLDALGL